jgi:hypothetical protein
MLSASPAIPNFERQTDCHKTLYEYATGGHHTTIFKFLQPVITTWGKCELNEMEGPLTSLSSGIMYYNIFWEEHAGFVKVVHS